MKPPKSFNTAVDFNGNQIYNVVIHNLLAHPGTVGNPPKEGQVYYNISNSPTIGKRLFLWNGSTWIDLAGFEIISNDIINRIVALENEGLPDAILKYGTVEVVNNLLTVPLNSFNWRVNKLEFLNTPLFSAAIPSATDFFYRSDILVGDDTGNYYIVEGTEDDMSAPITAVPNGMILLATIPIFGAIVQPPIIQPAITDYISKNAQKEIDVNNWYNSDSFIFYPSNGTSYKIQTISSSGYIGRVYNILDSAPFSGQEISITNKTGASFTIKHGAPSTSSFRNFYFPNGADFILEQSTTIKFKYINNSWTYLGSISRIKRHPYNTFKFIQKGVGNSDLDNDEIGDIFSGWSNDRTIRYTEAKWLGGTLTDSNNFIPLVQTQFDDIGIRKHNAKFNIKYR